MKLNKAIVVVGLTLAIAASAGNTIPVKVVKSTESAEIIEVIDVNVTDKDGYKYHHTTVNIHLKNSNKCKINIK